MVKVICAVLRCTEDETSSIIEHEKLRQSVSYFSELDLNSLVYYLALVTFIEIIFNSFYCNFEFYLLNSKIVYLVNFSVFDNNCSFYKVIFI